MNDSYHRQEQMLSYSSIDLFKWIAALLVASMHSRPFIQHDGANYYFTCICRIAVPFFFVFSSFIFYKKHNSIGSFIKRLLILYAVWFVLQSPITYYDFFIASDRAFGQNLLIFLRGLLISSTFPASWFITALWEGLLIVWIISKKLKWKWMAVVAILCALASLPGTMYYGLIKDTPLLKPYWLFNMAFCPAVSFITAIPYCIAGKYMAEKEVKLSSTAKWFFFISIIILGCIETIICRPSHYMSDTFIALFLFSPFLVYILLSTHCNLSNSLSSYFRKTSILIYFIHFPIIFVLNHFFGIEKGALCWFIVLFCAISLSSLIYFLSKKVKVLRYLY